VQWLNGSKKLSKKSLKLLVFLYLEPEQSTLQG